MCAQLWSMYIGVGSTSHLWITVHPTHILPSSIGVQVAQKAEIFFDKWVSWRVFDDKFRFDIFSYGG